MDVFKTAQKVIMQLGYFCKKSCQQVLSKIVQSGHTAPPLGNTESWVPRSILSPFNWYPSAISVTRFVQNSATFAKSGKFLAIY